VHRACNESYKLDEDYFVHSLMAFALGSHSGNELYKHVREKVYVGQSRKLIAQVLKEFEARPSGLALPGNMVVKRFDPDRIHRIIWKIVRGLYFHHYGKPLPEDLKTNMTLTSPEQMPPKHFLMFTGLPGNTSHGNYPGVFAYQFQSFTEAEPNSHYWALLLWDRIIVTIVFLRACRQRAAVRWCSGSS
jgi:hypothetical protein